MSKFNPYEILEVSKNDDISIIEKKFKKLAVKYHPDKNKDPSAKIIYENLSKAKDILTNPEKKSRYDKYGITDENDREYQEKMQQEMMIKHKLKEVIKLEVSINDILNGFTKNIKIKRDIINSHLRRQTQETLDINIIYDKSDPLNRPIIFENKGKKYDDNYGDLIIVLNVQSDNTFKINKSNNNLITTQKIILAQSLCGFEMFIPIGKNKPIVIQYDSVIKPGSVYCIKNMGLNIIDDNDILSKSDIEIHFDIQYTINTEIVDKLKTALNYNYIKSDKSLNPNIYSIDEYKEQVKQSNGGLEQLFEGGIPGFGMPMGGMPMGGMGNQQECHMS